jgi:ParB family chromosome partitioning protein
MSSSEKKELFSGKTFDQMLGLDDAPPEGTPLELDIDSLFPFPNQPFQPYKEEEMEKMVESIRENGVISPIVVRPKEDGTYEIISGHNRVEACRRAGFTFIPSFIREVDDATAVILMVDSNLRQREKLLPSEKAKAYKMKMEALKRQGERRDLTSCHDGTKFRSDDAVAENVQDSARQVQRFVRLNNLSPALMNLVDEGKLALTPAVEISYLDSADQEIVQEILERDQVSPSLSQAQKLRKLSDTKEINDKEIDRILTVDKPMAIN